MKALYDYEAAAPGELTIGENEILLAFELDEDWLLVQNQQENGGAGYIPGNYVEETTGEEPPPEPKIIIPTSVHYYLLVYVLPVLIINRNLAQSVLMPTLPTAWLRQKSLRMTSKRGQYLRWIRRARKRRVH